MEENKYCLDLWGGSQCVDKTDGVYYFSRDCGLFSCLTVLTYGIEKFTLHGYTPKNIILNLLEYDYNADYYNDLYKISDDDFILNDIEQSEMDHQMRYCEPSMIGIGRTKSHMNFKIFKKVYDKYFNLSDTVNQFIKEIEDQHISDYSNTVLIWARKTDKDLEIPVPEVDDYIKLIDKLNLRDKDIILQTDDIRVYNEFMSQGLKCRCLDEIPFAKDTDAGFHRKLCDVTDNKFYEMYGMTKKYYLQRILALVHVASKCNTLLIYPGNLATYIPLIRGNWDNVYSFQDKNNLIPE